jgi:hypothetical protein
LASPVADGPEDAERALVAGGRLGEVAGRGARAEWLVDFVAR